MESSRKGSVFDENIDKENSNLYDISNNRLLDADVEKHPRKEIAKKDIVDKQYDEDISKYQDTINRMINMKHSKIKQRQSISDMPVETLGQKCW